MSVEHYNKNTMYLVKMTNVSVFPPITLYFPIRLPI